MYKKIFIIAVLLFIFPLSAYCEGGNPLEGLKIIPYYTTVPIPPTTRQIQQEKTQMMGNEFTITIYASELSFKEIAQFYRERLGREGWEDMANNEKLKNLGKTDFFTQTLIFKKADEMINIQNLPSADPQETRFSLGRGNIQSLRAGEPEVSKVEFKDIPAYPNATAAPLSSMRTSTKEQTGYMTSDSVEMVMQFYRDKLSISGWQIESELPLNDFSGAQSLENCPGCEKLPSATMAKIQGSSMKMVAFNITKQGKSCYLGATEMSIPGGGSSDAKTIISISCNK
jgi:hypothetical protein